MLARKRQNTLARESLIDSPFSDTGNLFRRFALLKYACFTALSNARPRAQLAFATSNQPKLPFPVESNSGIGTHNYVAMSR